MKDTRIIYIADIRFPMERANAIQSVHTCHALAEEGYDVHFIVRKMDKLTIKECLQYYGLKENENMKLKRVKVVNSHGSYLIWKLSYLISSFFYITTKSLTRKKLIYFTRDLRIASIYSKIAKLFRAKVIFEGHTINYRHFSEIHSLYSSVKSSNERKAKKKRKFENKVYNSVDGIVVITDHLKTQMEADFNPSCPIVVVRDAAKPFKEDLSKVKKDGIYYIGQLYPWKGVDTLIEAMQHIKNEKLYIIGGLEYEKDLENLKKLTKKLKLDNQVEFKGTVPHREVVHFIKQAKLCVIPLPFSQIAAYFTSPMKLFEYLAAGKAIVASELPSLKEVLIDKENAMLFKPGDSRSLAKVINKVLSDNELRNKLEKHALETSKEHTWSKRAKRISKLIEKIS